MAREIEGSTMTGNFPPLIGIKNKGNFVKGKVLAIGTTANNNPVVTMSLIDLEGSTTVSESKGVYKEVDVATGDAVQIIGSTKQLREKLPQLVVGDVVTISFVGKKALKQGRSMNEFKVIVD